MNKLRYFNYSLLCAAAIGALMVGQPAMAQSASQIESIEQQIKALQSQLGAMKSDLATRDRAVRAAQAQAKAAQDQAAAATVRATQAEQAAAAAPTVSQVASAPAQPPGPPLPQGAFRVGGLTVTLGGFAAVEGIDRSRNMGSSIDTAFGSIPFGNSASNHIGEFRETAQQSRFSLLTEGNLSDTEKLTGYLETDFLSAGSSSNNNQSNSYTLRVRQFWGNYDNTDLGLHVLGGQAWSLATMYRNGLIPRQENVPLTIDAQYVVGFNWERQAQLRIVKDFDDHKIWAGLSLEEPATIFSSATSCPAGTQPATATGGGTLENTQCGGANVNSSAAYSDNLAPDIILKLAADPGWGHYEVYGLLRFLDGRTSFAATGTGTNSETTGEGIGGGMILPLIPKKLDFQLSGLIGQGVGRYGTSQLADAAFSPTGKIEPLSEYSIMGGFVGHPVPAVDLYAYGGAEGVQNKSYAGFPTAGYGSSALNLSGCSMELGACSAVTSSVVEGTIGGWWRVIKSAYGTAQIGAQYEFVQRNAFAGVGATKGSVVSPSANENMFLFSVRYLPFQ
ncbi:MAG TPA: hypothetical protein VHU42_07840 [Rhodopila sp.]|jgi:hypothetical protein|nr:hypothetical protein [Rhodopila sp.]